jgi:hypothetical protein
VTIVAALGQGVERRLDAFGSLSDGRAHVGQRTPSSCGNGIPGATGDSSCVGWNARHRRSPLRVL